MFSRSCLNLYWFRVELGCLENTTAGAVIVSRNTGSRFLLLDIIIFQSASSFTTTQLQQKIKSRKTQTIVVIRGINQRYSIFYKFFRWWWNDYLILVSTWFINFFNLLKSIRTSLHVIDKVEYQFESTLTKFYVCVIKLCTYIYIR